MEDNELQTSDVQDSAPSSEEQPVQQDAASKEGQPTQEAAPKQETPFHEHPRFKELVEQKNRYAEEAKAIREQLAEMQRQFRAQSQPKPTEDPLLARLKGIDPEFGERFEKLASTQKELQELKAWKQQFDAEQVRTQAVSQINKLHEENKVPQGLREMYDAQIQAAAVRNPNLGLQDLPNLYKQIHESYTKILDDARRAERESYVSSKKADSKVPTSQPKGTTVKPGKPEAQGTSAERKQNIVKEIMASMRSERSELGSH